ncbi:2,3-diaminopropionate biosynthesis protein SbnB [Streptomyces uncialis]|uniref:2,3-diaminopropionate biosynthesis protein SbnB n=1 Tax=Streptomyces uncialis TaxID=1048205 RepID=UPI002250B14C|nr:2,3-diaminopropionate biosynthesis protein SbnB [Streptomyces uncialis]MCX4657951.1 2,3-diaminopropionate biosynthesis protein SbnB [Streptomyces uncialis]
MFDFDLVPGPVVNEILNDDRSGVMALVRQTYLQHEAGESVNPDSHFLRFPEKPDARIIALPAFLGADVQLAGIKWISSFPANTRKSVPRASAVLILNDYETGYPIACLEAAQISAARTAASAAVAAQALRPDGYEGTCLAVVGAGVIARTVCRYLQEAGCRPASYLVHDVDETSGQALVDHLRGALGESADFTDDLGTALKADTVIFATTAGRPYVHTHFKPEQVVLNLSLRDLAPEVILTASNVFDDVEHCMKAETSPHLAEQAAGGRDFVTGTLAGVLTGAVSLPPGRPVIFSPFGLGILDLAVGAFVHRRARRAGTTVAVPDFFAETRRW